MSLVEDLTKNIKNDISVDKNISPEREEYEKIKLERNKEFEQLDKEIDEALKTGRRDSRITPYIDQPFLSYRLDKMKNGNHATPEMQKEFLRIAEKVYLSPESNLTPAEKAEFLMETVASISGSEFRVLDRPEFEDFLKSSHSFPYFIVACSKSPILANETPALAGEKLLSMFPDFQTRSSFPHFIKNDFKDFFDYTRKIQSDYDLTSFEAFLTSINLYYAANGTFNSPTYDVNYDSIISENPLLMSENFLPLACKSLNLSRDEFDTAFTFLLDTSSYMTDRQNAFFRNFALQNQLPKLFALTVEMNMRNSKDSVNLNVPNRNQIINSNVDSYIRNAHPDADYSFIPPNEIVSTKLRVRTNTESALNDIRINDNFYNNCFEEKLNKFLSPDEFLGFNHTDLEDRVNILADFCLSYDSFREAINIFSFAEFFSVGEYQKAYSLFTERLFENGYSFDEFDVFDKQLKNAFKVD